MAIGNLVKQVTGWLSAASPAQVDDNGKLTLPTTPAASAVCGTAVLSAGTATVSTTAVAAASLILVFRLLDGGTVGGLLVAKTADITAGTSFVIRSLVSSTAGAATAAGSDTSTVGWIIFN